MKDLKQYGIQLLKDWGYDYSRKSKARGNNEVFTNRDTGTEYTVIFQSRRIPSNESPDEVLKYERIERIEAAAEADVIFCYTCLHELDGRIRALAFKLEDAEQVPTYNDAPAEGFNYSVLEMRDHLGSTHAFKEFQEAPQGITYEERALFENGVYETVLEEILNAQSKNPNLDCYIHPFKRATIRMLKKEAPTPDAPVLLYISTTKQLSQICYTAEIIGWEDKREISSQRKDALLKHYKQYQPGEFKYFLTDEEAVNIITIRNLKQCTTAHSTSILHKVSDGLPLKPRTRAGGWSQVVPIADLTTLPSQTKERYDAEFNEQLSTAKKLTEDRLSEEVIKGVANPEKVQIISVAYKRSAAVVEATLRRAKGICEQCKQPAPFKRKSDGSPYLEVHHWTALSDSGSDTLDNTAALCPNCHREVHHG